MNACPRCGHSKADHHGPVVGFLEDRCHDCDVCFLIRSAEVAEETTAPFANAWWYHSFCDPTLPTGTQFLGACYVQAPDMITSITKAHALRINPGGEVKTWGPLSSQFIDREVAEEFRHKLLSKADLIAQGGYVQEDGQRQSMYCPTCCAKVEVEAFGPEYDDRTHQTMEWRHARCGKTFTYDGFSADHWVRS